MSDYTEFGNKNMNIEDNGTVKAIWAPQISSTNMYCDYNIYTKLINMLPVGYNSLTNASNLGTGEYIFNSASNNTIYFKSLKAAPAIDLSSNSNEIIIDANVGSTTDTLTAGDDGRLSTPNIIIVKESNPGPGEYNSIYAAINFVSSQTRDDNHRWAINISPGIYVEPLLVVPDFISIIGENILQTIIEPDGDHDCMSLGNSCEVSFLTIRNVPHGYTAVVCNDVGDFAQLHKISISNSYRGVYMTSPTIESQLYLEYVDINDNITQGILVDCVAPSTINLENTYVFADGIIPEFAMKFNSNILATIFSGSVDGASGPGIICGNGSHCEIKAFQITNCSVGISDINPGSGAEIDLSSTEFESCTENIRITNQNTIGYYNGNNDLSKISINSLSGFYISNRDDKIILVSKKGGDFTSIEEALDYITDSSSSNIYTIRVGPGIYTENTLTMKKYVNIIGSGTGSTQVHAISNGINLFIGAPNTIIENMDIYGGTSTDDCAINYNGDPVNGVFSVRQCRFGSGYNLIKLSAASGNIIFEAHSISILSTAATTYGFIINNANTVNICNVDISKIKLFYPSSVMNLFDISGQTTVVGITNILANKANLTGTCVNVYNGASVWLSTGTIIGFNTGISLPANGAGPIIAISDIICKNSATYDLQINNISASGNINGSFNENLVQINQNVTNISLQYLNSGAEKGSIIVGDIKIGRQYDQIINMVDFLVSQNVGLMHGGDISVVSDLTVNVAYSEGYVVINPGVSQYLKFILFDGDDITLPSDTTVYLYINSNGILSYDVSRPNNITNLILGRVCTNSSGVEFIDATPVNIGQFGNYIDNFIRNVFGAIFSSGSTVTVDSSLRLSVTSGIYWLAEEKITTTGISNGAFKQYYRDSSVTGWNISTTSTITNSNYNPVTSLISIPVSQFVKHSLYLIGAMSEQYMLVVGQGAYADASLAESSSNVVPSFFTDGVVPIAEIIVQQGSTSVIIKDIRPRPAYAADITSNTVSSHSSLSNLNADDHTQYVLVNGSRGFSGNLDLGGNNITNVTLVDGVDISSHASRHLPGGPDALAVGTPATIGTNNAAGVANSFARSDHIHSHGIQSDATLHAAVSSLSNGFMISSDKVKLDSATTNSTPGTLVLRDGSGNITINSFSSNNIGLQAGGYKTNLVSGSPLGSNITFTLPTTTGQSGQYLVTDGGGNLSWASFNANTTRILVPFSSIVSSPNNDYLVRLGRAAVLSGSVDDEHFEVNEGENGKSDFIQYKGSISSVRAYVTLQFTSISSRQNVSLELSCPSSVSKTRTSTQTVQSNQNGFTTSLNIEIGGINPEAQILPTIIWGLRTTVTLIDGYLIVEL
jgi:hypothetical protein